MNTKLFSEAITEVNDKYYEEAVNYKKKAKMPIWAKLGGAAACLIMILVIGSVLVPFQDSMAVSVYACGTDQEITAAGVVMSSGTISDSGEMKGHPLMFYLSGKDIASVRFSCKNQQISFTDWTEKREEYGNAQNFTVAYGEDESEYYYLTIDWVPDTLIRELTDHADSTIASLPKEMRHDIIVMEITFENGETATKAITISLLDDGTFSAVFDDYRISEADTFVNRPDSGAADEEAAENTITFSGTIVENTIDTLVPVILVKPHGDEIPYDAVFFELPDEEANWGLRVGEDVTITCSDTFTEPAPHYGTLISITEETAITEQNSFSAAEVAARAYYADTVFEVVSLELKSQTESEVIFSVCVSKGGVVQEPDRSITLQVSNGAWEVVNEGY